MERYELRIVEMPDLIMEIDSLWDRLQSDDALKEDASDAGIDLSKLPRVRRSKAIKIETVGHGISGAELFDASVISAMSGAHIVVWDLWKKVILPRLQQRFGKDAVKQASRASPRGGAKPKVEEKKNPKKKSARDCQKTI
jgi:hypothetical protein